MLTELWAIVAKQNSNTTKHIIHTAAQSSRTRQLDTGRLLHMRLKVARLTTFAHCIRRARLRVFVFEMFCISIPNSCLYDDTPRWYGQPKIGFVFIAHKKVYIYIYNRIVRLWGGHFNLFCRVRRSRSLCRSAFSDWKYDFRLCRSSRRFGTTKGFCRHLLSAKFD